MRHRLNGITVSASSSQEVLSFLVEDPSSDFLASQVQKATGLSKAAVYRALDELARKKLVAKHQRGKVVFYSAIGSDVIIRQFKVLKTVEILKTLVDKLKRLSYRIVLFGSAARGEDYKDSDIDLLIIAKDLLIVQSVISAFKCKHKIQAVVKTAPQMEEFEEKEKEFINEINAGIVLWEEGHEH